MCSRTKLRVIILLLHHDVIWLVSLVPAACESGFVWLSVIMSEQLAVGWLKAS